MRASRATMHSDNEGANTAASALTTTAAAAAAAASAPSSASSAPFAVVAPLSSELLLLAEILSAWRGYPSPLFARNEHSGHVRFTPRVSLAHLSDGSVERLVADFASWINLKADVQKFMSAFGGHQATHGRCLQSFCACLSSILDRYDAMLLPFDTELRGQIHSLSAGLPFAPTQPPGQGQGQGQEQSGAEVRSNVPLTLLSFQHYIAPYIQQMVLLGDLVHRAAPRLYHDDERGDGGAVAAAAGVGEFTAAHASSSPTSASLLTLLHSSLELHSLLCTEQLSSLLFCLFLSALLPYLEYLDEFTQSGLVSARAEEDCFFVRRRADGAAGGDFGASDGGDEPAHDDGRDDDRDDDGDDGQRRPPRVVQADASDSLVLRLGPDGQPFAPSFLQPYAAHILLTGRGRAMVRAIRRTQSRAGGEDGQEDGGEEGGDATPLFSEFGHAAASSSSDPSASVAEAAGPNLFRSFHEGLMELFRVHEAPSSLDIGTDGDVMDPSAADADAAAAVSDSPDSDGSASASESGLESEFEPESESASQSESEHDRSDSDSSVSSGSGSHSPRRRRRPHLSVQPELAEPAGGAIVAEPAALALAVAAPASSPRPAGTAAAAAELSAADQAQMAIFFSTGFEEVHPLFKPPVEPPQPTAAEVAASATVQTHALPQQQPEKQLPGRRTRQHRRVSSGEPHHSPSSAPPPGIPSQSSWPSVAASLAPAVAPSSACSFLSPVLWRNAITVQASGDRARATLQGNDPRCFVPPMRPVEDEQHRGDDGAAAAEATVGASSALGASSFLTELAPATSLPALQLLVDLLLFHAHFPTYALHEALHRCLLCPLQRRFLDSNQEFMRTIMHRCGLNYHLAGLREVFLMADGFMSHDFCRALFDKLDAGESDIIGLNHLLQDTLSRYSSPTLRRFLARSFTLVLIETPTAGAAAAAASAAGSAASPRELVSPSNPQSLAALEQLRLECAIAWPLSRIITPEAVAGYNKVWRLLLQVRRAELALTDCALSGTSAAPHSRANLRAHAAAVLSGQVGRPTPGRPLSRSPKYFRNTSGCAHAFHLLKSELQHFTRNILEYLLGNCVAGRGWGGLLAAMGRHAGSGDVDQLRALHQQYLDNILFHCLLTPKLSVALDAIKRVLGLCLDLRLLYRTVLVDYMEGKASDYIFAPPPASSSGINSSSGGRASYSTADAAQWSRWTGRAGTARRGSIDMYGEDASFTGGGDDDEFSPAGPRRISIPGVHSFAQLQTRLYETAMEQMNNIRNDLRQTVRFLLTLLTKIVDSAVNTHRQTPTHK